jgi:hypothetical protein
MEGANRLSVQCNDQRAFSVLMRVVRWRSLDEVRGLVPAPAAWPTARAFLERELSGPGAGAALGDGDDSVGPADVGRFRYIAWVKCHTKLRSKCQRSARESGCQAGCPYRIYMCPSYISSLTIKTLQ